MTWMHDKTTEILTQVEEAKAEKAYPFFRPMENVGAQVKVGTGSYINFTSNDYLGLSRHPKVMQAAIEGIEKYGTGLGSARPQAHSIRHDELERRLARWLGFEACCNFTTGYQSLVGSLSAFLDDDTTLVLDRLSHASIIEGALLSQGQHPDMEMRFFKHNNPKVLQKVLRKAEHQKKMVVVEGLYSVDGDLGRIDAFAEICKEEGAILVVDDAHGIGTLGPTGRGVGEVFDVMDGIDILIGTFSKSFGGVGGFVCADEAIVDYMKLTARSFMFSASLPVAQVDAALAALDIIESDLSLLKHMRENAEYFREGLLDLGFDLGDSDTHITPIMLGDQTLTLKFAAYLFHGAEVMMMPFISPGVPPGKERLRCNVTAAHTKAQLGYTLEALAEIGDMLEVLPKGTKTRANNLQRSLWFADHKLRGVRNAGLPYVGKQLGAVAEKAKGLLFND